jgi:uncharacterized protein (TIGR03435 family)
VKHTLHSRLYHLILRLHPAAFRNEFAREMALDFENALHTYGFAQIFLDATGSLARQWSARILSGAPNPISAPTLSLLAGNYVIVQDKAFTPLELGHGLLASTAMLTLCSFALTVSPGHTHDFPIVYASSSAPATDRNSNPGTRLPTGESSSSGYNVSKSAVVAFAQIGTPATAPPSNGSTATPTLGCTLAGFAQTQPKPGLLLFHPSGPLPSYEVATIKPLDPNAASGMVRLPPGASLSPLSIRRYTMNAYGAIYSPQVVGGPDWLNKDAYLIKGKIPDDLESALQKMRPEDRIDQTRMMEQCLLADRFHLQAHFETRVLRVYELLPAKGGLKITEVPAPPERKPGDPPPRLRPSDPLPPGFSMTTLNSNGLRVLNGRAIKMQVLARIIGGDIGDRPIVDHTGFTGYFDITGLAWAPLGDTGATSEPDAPSVTGALEEKLGLRLVPAKDPIEVLVIDRIERPTPN